MCHDFTHMPLPQLLMETIEIWICCQHLSILYDKKKTKKKTLQWFSHQRRKSKLSSSDPRTNWNHNRRLCGECSAEYRDLSRCRFVSRDVSRFETTGTVPSTHKLSDDRSWVAGNRRPSMAHGIPPFSGTKSPSVCAFSLAVKCGCCVHICCGVRHRALEET